MRTRHIVIGIAVIALAAGAGLAISAALKSSRDAATAAATPQPTPTTKVWMAAFRWSGGGPSNDIRNSKPFTLEGGHQRVAVSSQEIVTEYSMSMQGWTIESADGGSEMEMVNPASFGESQSDLYLPAGSYYLSSNTVDCTWTLTVSEER